MQFYTTKERAERTAHLLVLETAMRHNRLPEDICRDAVARMHGFTGWAEMADLFGTRPLSPEDAGCDVVEVDARHSRQRSVLKALMPMEDDAADLVLRDIGASTPASTASWIDDMNRRPSVRCGIHVLDMDSTKCVCISLDDLNLFSKPFSYFVMAKDGNPDVVVADGFCPTPDIAAASLRKRFGEHRGVSFGHQDMVGNLLGYELPHLGHRLKDTRDRVHRQTTARVTAAREILEAELGSEPARILFSGGRLASHGTFAAYALPGPVGDARRAFGIAWPDFAESAMVSPSFRAPEEYAFDAFDTPDGVMAAIVRQATKLPEYRSAVVVDRLRGKRWPMRHVDLDVFFSAMDALSDTNAPSDKAGAASFVSVCKILQDSIRPTVPDRADAIRSIVASIEGREWNAIDRHVQQIAFEKACENGWEADPGQSLAISKADVMGNFYCWIDNMVSTFMWTVAEPALALRNDAVRFVHLRSRQGTISPNVDGQDFSGFVIPPTPFENACTHLFLDGITFDDLVRVSEEWGNRIGKGNKLGGPPTLDAGDIGEALDSWRHLMRPQHAGITVEELVDATLAGLERQGASIADLTPASQLMVSHMG